jgi:phosphopantothenoylcysteine decarboxylase / phosphopantothenate---cysteine ligase
MTNPFDQKHILLGITGSIAAYKGTELASKLHQAGAIVDVILTESAAKFVSPLTFQSVTGRKAFTDAELWGGEAHVVHVGLGHAADLVLIAPASANTIAKLANGIADNLLSVACLAASGVPLVIAPAMDVGMFSHPATQANVETLVKRGAVIIGPAEGHLASGLVGPGRFVEPLEILAQVRYLLAQRGPLAGKKVVVTAGGTAEAIDPVRVITNRSSGKQGYAVARSALDAGAQVTLITAPTSLPIPYGARVIHVTSAAEMLAAVLAETPGTDALIMSAAVADYRPLRIADQKIKKNKQSLTIELEPTQDILAAVAKQKETSGFPRYTIGFAAESQNLMANAGAKLTAKRLDMIVANDISAADAGFEVDTNRVTLLFANGSKEELPLMSKDEVASQMIDFIVGWISE